MVGWRLVLQEELGVAGRRSGEVPAGVTPAPADCSVVCGLRPDCEQVLQEGSRQTCVRQHGSSGALGVATGGDHEAGHGLLSCNT